MFHPFRYILYWQQDFKKITKYNAFSTLTIRRSSDNKEDFQIIGNSADEDKEKWWKEIKEDYVQWASLIDSDNLINDKWVVSSYPTSFLLNSDFEIVDKDLDSEKLKERLKQVLE